MGDLMANVTETDDIGNIRHAYPYLSKVDLPSYIFSDESYNKITEMETWLYEAGCTVNCDYAFTFIESEDKAIRSAYFGRPAKAPVIVFGFTRPEIATLFKLAWSGV